MSDPKPNETASRLPPFRLPAGYETKGFISGDRLTTKIKSINSVPGLSQEEKARRIAELCAANSGADTRIGKTSVPNMILPPGKYSPESVRMTIRDENDVLIEVAVDGGSTKTTQTNWADMEFRDLKKEGRSPYLWNLLCLLGLEDPKQELGPFAESLPDRMKKLFSTLNKHLKEYFDLEEDFISYDRKNRGYEVKFNVRTVGKSREEALRLP